MTAPCGPFFRALLHEDFGWLNKMKRRCGEVSVKAYINKPMKYALNEPPESPLFILCQADLPRSVRWMIENGADTRYRNDATGFNCLHMAVSANSPKNIEILLETEGATEMLQERMCEGLTPLEFVYRFAEKTNTPINHRIVELLRTAQSRQWRTAVAEELAEMKVVAPPKKSRVVATDTDRIVATDRTILD